MENSTSLSAYLYAMQKQGLFKVFCALWVLLMWSACTENESQRRFEKVATAYCECTAQLADLNRKAQQAGPSNLNEYFQQMQTEYARAKDCAATIIGQFGHLKAAELDSVNVFLRTKCPDLADKKEQLQELLGE